MAESTRLSGDIGPDADSDLLNEKKFYERFYALHRDPILLPVFQEFGISVFRRSSVLEGLDTFLKTNKFSGQCCVEIGTCNGLTAIVLSRYFSHVVSYDIVPSDFKHEIAEFCCVKNITFVDCKGNEEKSALIESLTFDAAYVDGDHARDTKSDFDLVKRCGRVLFHEYWPAQPAVVNLVNGLSNVIKSGKFALWMA